MNHSAFSTSSFLFPQRTGRNGVRAQCSKRRPYVLACENLKEDEAEKVSKLKNPKFDPDSDMDAFGHDPRKATDFWRDSARDLLQSKQVVDAIDEHSANSTNPTNQPQDIGIEMEQDVSPSKEEASSSDSSSDTSKI